MPPWVHVLRPGEVLMALRPSDAKELFALVDAERAHLREWLPWLDANRSVDDTATFLEEAARQEESNGCMTCGIRVGGRLAGVIGYHRIDWANRATKLGYWLAAARQGRGVMTLAAEAMTTHAFEGLGLHRMEIRAATGNLRSSAIPRRLGFRHEGTLHDAEWLYDHWVDLEVFATTEPLWNAGREERDLGRAR